MEIIFLIPVILWFAAYNLLSKSKFLKHFIISNIAIAIVGFYILSLTEIIDLGHDEYGLGKLFALLLFGFGHSILGFLFGIAVKSYQK